MKSLTKTKVDYENLRIDLAEILEEGRKQAVTAVSKILVRTYWEVGRRLSRERAALGHGEVTPFLVRLGNDLGVGPTVIHDALKFYRTYPDRLPDHPGFRSLSWRTHTTLLTIGDAKERAFYLDRAIAEGWSRLTMRNAIRAKLYRGISRDGGESQAAAPKLESPSRELHNYEGIVERVIDGDTIEVRIDLGFDVWRVETIRLRGVDAPEMGSAPGRRAKKFVTRRLAEAPFVGLKTYKTDKYARYIADVFYSTEKTSSAKTFERGVFLNQELIDQGVAGLLDLPV